MGGAFSFEPHGAVKWAESPCWSSALPAPEEASVRLFISANFHLFLFKRYVDFSPRSTFFFFYTYFISERARAFPLPRALTLTAECVC